MIQLTVSSHEQVKPALSQTRQRQQPGGVSCQVTPLLWQEWYQVTLGDYAHDERDVPREIKISLSLQGWAQQELCPTSSTAQGAPVGCREASCPGELQGLPAPAELSVRKKAPAQEHWLPRSSSSGTLRPCLQAFTTTGRSQAPTSLPGAAFPHPSAAAA